MVSSAAGCVGTTYHCSCVSDGSGVQRAGARGAADAVGMANTDSWTGHHGGRDATGCRFDSLLRGLGQGLLTVQQRQPQGRKAFLMTGRDERKRERGGERAARGFRDTHVQNSKSISTVMLFKATLTMDETCLYFNIFNTKLTTISVDDCNALSMGVKGPSIAERSRMYFNWHKEV